MWAARPARIVFKCALAWPPCTSRDAFIASTGCIPGEHKTLQENALNLARMALEMQRLCSKLKAPDGSPVVMRIGLHCGPVVGGIVGGNSAFPLLLLGPADPLTGAFPRARVFFPCGGLVCSQSAPHCSRFPISRALPQ